MSRGRLWHLFARKRPEPVLEGIHRFAPPPPPPLGSVSVAAPHRDDPIGVAESPQPASPAPVAPTAPQVRLMMSDGSVADLPADPEITARASYLVRSMLSPAPPPSETRDTTS